MMAMRSSFKIFCIWFLLIIVGCKTNPPTTPFIPPVEYGMIYVTSNISGATIYIDNLNSGKLTPDTVLAPVGERTIRLEKDNYIAISQNLMVEKDSVHNVYFELEPVTVSKIVLLEDFANVSCDPCVVSNIIIHNLISSTFGPAKLIAIKYPTNFPAPNDLFYLANKDHSNARIQYYNVFSAPTTRIDGLLRPPSLDSNAIKQRIEERLALTPPFNILVEANAVGTTYKIKVTVQTIEPSGIDFPNLVLHTVITETDIAFPSPPGSNGETKFYDVMRTMLPNSSGEAISNLNQPGTYNFEWEVDISPKWNGQLNVVAFIQDHSTKEVYQTGSTF